MILKDLKAMIPTRYTLKQDQLLSTPSPIKQFSFGQRTANNFTTNGYVFFSFGVRESHFNVLSCVKVAIGLIKDTIIAYILNEIYKVNTIACVF